jgi:hypothetical protein
MRVFLLWHTRIDAESEDSKLLGVYSSENTANAARGRASMQAGFREYPDGFEITAYEVDRDEWSEGFGIDDPAP